MATFIATYPPLGQVTQLEDSAVVFHAVVEAPHELAAEPWQLVLWHSNSCGGDWTETELVPAAPDSRPSEVHEVDGALAMLFFTARVAMKSSLNFTIKFRHNPDHDWQWVRNEQGSDDGIVVINQSPTRADGPDDLPDLIRDLNPDLRWRNHASQSPGTRLWSVEAAVDGAREDRSTYAEVPLGVPWGRFLRWFALVRSWTPWLAPSHGKSSFGLDKDALLCSFLSPRGKHMVFLGMSDLNDVVTLFRSGDSGDLMLHIRNDNPKDTTGTVLVAVGDNFESAIAAVMYQARSLVTAANAAMTGGAAESTAGGDVRPEWYEDWYDGLGYCTWNSLGQQLTEEKVLKALDTLAENKINISTLIIDDNWQDVDYRGDGQWQHGWKDFEAEPKTFPRGLKALISDIRSKHKNIQHIAVWHALLGYWAGLAPGGPLAKRYKTVEVVRSDAEPSQLPIDGKMTVVAKDDVQNFYNDFYRFLSSCGVDGVKTDAQYMLDTLVSPAARRDLINPYLDAWTIASLNHFSGKVISCMSQAPPILFHAQLPRNRPAVVYRNSDDYFPSAPAAHPWHVWTNAYNALFTQHLSVVLDWDMFQTEMRTRTTTTTAPHVDDDDDDDDDAGSYAGFHAAARCVSGGPVCLTDPPGQHDAALLRQLTGVAPRGGRAVVLRPGVPGRALDVYAAAPSYERGALALLRVGAYHGRAETGTGIVGLFNVSAARRLVDLLPLARFPGVVVAAAVAGAGAGVRKRYVVRSHVTGRLTAPLEAGGGAPAPMLAVSLGVRGYDILCAFPLTAVASRTRGEVLLANLGLVGKMTGCAAVLGTACKALENGRVLVDATLKALGVLGIYISALPELSIQAEFMVTMQGQPIPPHTLSVNKEDRHVLDVDIETAWEEMGLSSGWANQVEVKIYFALEK